MRYATDIAAGGRRSVDGGETVTGALGSAERCLPVSRTRVPIPDMLSTHTFHLAMRLPDGRVLIAVGASGPGAGDTAGAGDTTGAETYSG
jgi:hypothetical protein